MATPSADASPRRQLLLRLGFFFAGAILNYFLISKPFKFLSLHTALPVLAISGCSIGLSSIFFFIWNYFINFRTDSRKRDALARYVGAVGAMWALSSLTLTFFKSFEANLHLAFIPASVDRDVIATQFLIAGFKFLLYHFWVFPLPKTSR